MIARRHGLDADRLHLLHDQPGDRRRSSAPTWLGLTIPFPLYGIFRYLYLVHQREGGGSPADLLLNDRPLLACVTLWVVGRRSLHHLCLISTSAPTRSTSSRSWSRSAPASARSAAWTTPSSRSASWRRSSSRSSSIRAACDPICSSSSARRSRPYDAAGAAQLRLRRQTLFESHRAPLRWIRRLLHPILKLFFNPEPADPGAAHPVAAEHDERRARGRRERRGAFDQLQYEVLHNLVLETTRLGIEVKNLKMRVESLTSRLEFNERRARALESVVVYKPSDETSRQAREPRRARSGARRPPAGDRTRRDAGRAASRRRTAPGAGTSGEGPGPAQPPAPAAPRPPRRRLGVRDHGRRRRQRRRGAAASGRRDRRRAARRSTDDGRSTTATPTASRRATSTPRRCRRRTRAPSRTTGAGRPRGPDDDAVKLAVVVQRYGQAINGGAELHARYIAEHLARHAEVEVLTTCATDYVTWRNELPPGVEHGQRRAGAPVSACKHERDPLDVRPAVRSRLPPAAFARRRARLARRRRARPARRSSTTSRSTPRDYDYCIFFSYRYYHAYHGARAAARRARSWCRRRNATRRSASRSSRRSSAASGR